MHNKLLAKFLTNQKPIYATEGWLERDYQLRLAELIGGNLEVRCPIGRIDIVTNHYIVETKFYSTHGNKSALGQVLCYTYYYPGYTPCIALIGKPRDGILAEVCANFGIAYLFFYNGLWQLA